MEPNEDSKQSETESVEDESFADNEIWESDEGVSPEDNAEVWENEKDYSDENVEEEKSIPVKERIKSIFKHDSEGGMKRSILGDLKFDSNLGENSGLDSEFGDSIEEDIQKQADDIKDTKSDLEDKVDLGSDDDYIYVDHSNDEPAEEDNEPKVTFNKSVKYTEPIEEEPVKEDKYVESEPIIEENIKEKSSAESETDYDDKVDLGSDDDYI